MTPPSRTRHLPTGGGVAASAIVLLTMLLSLAWSHERLLWNDEFLSFYSDSVGSLRGVLQVQGHTPISLDPPTYHLLSHLSMNVVGRNAVALRLPALAGFVLLQVALFALVRRLAGHRAALFAMALPLCTASFRYAVEGRPYGLLLGLYAASLTCWYFATAAGQAAAPSTHRPSWPRWIPLLGLALSIVLAITSHYFGLLILLPVGIGETVRTLERRRFDGPVCTALLAGCSGIGLILPFKAALAPYQRHYYTGSVNLRNVSQGYREIFIRYNTWPLPLQHGIALLLVAATLALFWAVWRRYRSRPAAEPGSLWAALLALAALPFFGYLFGRFVTHTMEVRYVVAALLFFVVAIALVAAPLLRSRTAFGILLGGTLVLGAVLTAVQVRGEARFSRALLAELQQPPPAQAASLEEPIYVQTLADDFLRTYYTSDPRLRHRYVLLYDAGRELRWLDHDTNAVTAVYLQQFTPLRTARFADMASSGSALALLAEPGGWNWLRPEISGTPRLSVTPLGSMGGMHLVRLQWQPRPSTP